MPNNGVGGEEKIVDRNDYMCKYTGVWPSFSTQQIWVI